MAALRLDEPGGGREEEVLVDTARSELLAPVTALVGRQRELQGRLEECLNSSLESRALLREVEGLLHRAPASIEDDGEEGAASAASGSVSARAVPGLRPSLASRAGPPPRAGSARARTHAGGLASVPGRPGVAGGGLGAGEGVSSATSGDGGEVDAEALREARLQKCAVLEARVAPMRSGLDAWGGELVEARESNARLRAAVEDALTFSEAELAAELAAQDDEAGAASGREGAGAGLDDLGEATANAVAGASARAAARAAASGRGLPVASFRSASHSPPSSSSSAAPAADRRTGFAPRTPQGTAPGRGGGRAARPAARGAGRPGRRPTEMAVD